MGGKRRNPVLWAVFMSGGFAALRRNVVHAISYSVMGGKKSGRGFV